MRHIYVLLVGVVFLCTGCGQEKSKTKVDAPPGATVYYLIRHAEKDRSDAKNTDPNLTAEGKKRAERWAERFEDVPLDAVYSTDFNRTKQTATPTADQKKLSIKIYNPTQQYNEAFQEATKGKQVLIVGHSNTTPQFANAIMGRNHFPPIDDGDNSNLYIVTITKDGEKLPQQEKMD